MNIVPLLVGVLPFAVVMSFTPGPNNLMLASAGARFGFARTLPHQAGIVVGFAVMTLCIGLGIAALIASAPRLYLTMKIASIGYILYLAWKTGTATTGMTQDDSGKPMRFLAAAGFQWLNPKAWIMTVTAMTTYTSPGHDQRMQIAVLTLVFGLVGAASSATWVIAGQMIRRRLTSPRRLAMFNWVMAVLLVGSIVPALFEH